MARSRLVGVVVLVLLSLVAAGAQTAAPKPGPEHQKLAVFLGKWTAEGQAFASPYGPAGRMTSTETFAWLPGNFFMEHQWDARQGAVHNVGREILGFDPVAKTYFSHFFDSLGNSGINKFTITGNTFTLMSESVVAGKPLKERGTIVVSGNTFTNKAEYSTDGVTWLPNFEIELTRAK
jgi:hypothetical protein